MIERGLDISTADGAMNRWTVRPDDCGPLPVVIMLMDAPGVRDGLKEICRRIAQSGYYVLLPNLYCRTTRAFVLGQTRDHADGQAFLERMFRMVGSISNDKIAADTGAALERLHERPIRHRGGGEACGRIGCFASYYGTRLITAKPDSPHLRLGDITAEGVLRIRRARYLRAA